MRKLLAFVAMLTAVVLCFTGVAAAEFNPGTYSVEMLAHNGNIKLDVTFSAEKIEKIELVEHEESKQLGDVAIEMIAAEIVERQSLNVDTIAGATISSAVAKAAITQAVKDAGGDPAAMQEAKAADTAVLPDENVDIVVVGAGAAGMAAATEAAELGLDVILVEQLGILGGSSMRAGGIQGADTSILAKYGQTFTKEQHFAQLSAPVTGSLHPDTLDVEYCKIAVDNWSDNIEWFVGLGVEFQEPWGGLGFHWDAGGARNAWRLIKAMHERMDELKADYRLNTKAESLIIEDGAVKGIVATAPNGTQYKINAKGVVLATGGYLANKEVVAKYLPGFENGSYDVSMGCDGSGLLMALEAGADTKAMDSAGMHALACMYRGISRSLTMPAHCGGIAVNSKGERYFDENAPYAELTTATKAQGDVWLLMDEATFTAPAVATDIGGNPDMYVICDTLEELAVELGIDAEGLKTTAERYGEFVRNGVDEDFGKAKSGLVGDFSKGPYYGVKTVIENHTVYGGVVVNNDAQVLNANGEVIEGLLGAGEFVCFKTPGRGPLAEAIDFGRIAARTVKAAVDAE